jgi:hypothetical protein
MTAFFPPPAPTALGATSVLNFLRGAARPDPAAPLTVCRLELEGRVWTVRMVSGRVEVQAGEPATAAASIRTDPKTFSALLTGDMPAVERLLRSVQEEGKSSSPMSTSLSGSAK